MTFDALQGELRNLSGLLDQVGEEGWSSWARRAESRLASGRAVPEDIRSAFGGMGSLNDLVIHPANGHEVASSEVEAVNTELDGLRSRIWQLSQQR